MGLWQVAVVWGFGVTIAIYATASLSGAHLNPAVSLAFALLRRDKFPGSRLLPYAAAQLSGAILAGATIAALFWPFLLRFEEARGIVRGGPGSELSAMVFGEYFPNPALFGTDAAARSLVSPLHAALVEGFGTAVLVFVIFALTARTNREAPGAGLVPFFIGFTVAALISLFAPITQAGWNPARDFGPRLVAFVLGWGAVAIPGPDNGFWVYIVGPLIGGPAGGWVWQLVNGGPSPAARVRAGMGSEQRKLQGDGEMAKQRVLFIGTHNSARSQMAEGWLRHLGGGRYEVSSAGTEATPVRPLAVKAMADVGVDISGQESKTLERYLNEPWDYVITVCDQANEACPLFPAGKRRLHWSFPDPSQATGTEEQQLKVYRQVRDGIRWQIEAHLPVKKGGAEPDGPQEQRHLDGA